MAQPQVAVPESRPPWKAVVPVENVRVESRARHPSYPRVGGLAGALVAIAAAAVVYRPILLNFFHADDFQTLQSLANLPLPRFVLEPGAGHIYLLRNLAYEAFYRAFGTDTTLHFGAVLLTHLLNVGLLYVVLRRLGAGVPLACFGATLWGTSPAHGETLGWYAVYGHVLVATLVLVVLVRLAGRVRDRARLTTREALLWVALLLLAGVTFGVGVGVALVFPVVLVLFPGERTTAGARWLLWALPVVLLGVYAAWHWLYAAAYGTDMRGILMLLGIMRNGWQVTCAMFVNLLVAGTTWLLGGFALPPDMYPTEEGYVLAASLAVLILLGVQFAPAPTWNLLFVFVVLACGAYAIIAAGRGGLLIEYSTMFGADVPRYHYVATLLLTVIVCLLLGWLGTILRVGPVIATVQLTAWLAFAAALYGLTDWQIEHYDNDRRAVAAVLQEIQEAVAVTPPGEPVVLENRPFGPALLPQYFVGSAGLYTIYYPHGLGRPVYFVTHDRRAYAQAVQGSRLAAVMVRTRRRRDRR